MDVYLLHHISHGVGLPAAAVAHRAEDDEVDYDEVIGIFASKEALQRAIDQARELPGFGEEPDCFLIDTYTLDEACWTDGFVQLDSAGEAVDRARGARRAPRW